jgi:ribosomal protein S12 methylthiotransferase accessory factor YcaO
MPAPQSLWDLAPRNPPWSSTPCEASVRPWRAERQPKYSQVGVARVVRPAETVRRIEPLMSRIGVTRIGDVTRLDRNGIPNFIAVRPCDLGPGITYYNGKGPTRSQARASAMMEAIERYSGERCDLPVLTASYERLIRRAPAVNPAELIAPLFRDPDPDLELEWVEGFDLIGCRPTFVPLNSVVCPYEPSRAIPPIFFSSTNGLASGNTRDEALCHALCEVNERDALALYHANSCLRGQVGRVLEALGQGGCPLDPELDGYGMIETDGLPPRASRLLDRLVRSDLKVYLRDITSETGIATIFCVVAERRQDGGHVAHGGFGSHPDGRVALTRALTEAAQSRLACIQGGREDLPAFAQKGGPVADPDRTYGTGPLKPFLAVNSRQHECVTDDVEWILSRLQEASFRQIVAVDLTRPELGVPVVRVVVPLAETWTVFHLHTARAVLGPRVLKLITG